MNNTMSPLRQIADAARVMEEEPRVRLTGSVFVPDPLPAEQAEMLTRWHKEGKRPHEQEVMHLMGRHAQTPDPDILARAIAVLEHLQQCQQNATTR